MKEVIVLDYNPIWKDKFYEIKKYLEEVLQDIIIKIEHVGSTSVIGLASKPIIDIDIVCEINKFEIIKERLEQENYIFEGDLGIPGRFAFKRKDDFFPYHLYVCYRDSIGYRNHILFRDYMNKHESLVKEYSLFKKKIALENQFDIDGYMKAKDDFNKNIISLALKGV